LKIYRDPSGSKVSLSKVSKSEWKLIVYNDEDTTSYRTKVDGGEDGWITICAENSDGDETVDEDITIHMIEVPALIKVLYRIYSNNVEGLEELL